MLKVPVDGDAATVETEVEIAPRANTQLMGLYASNGMLCTQCEAEGFRRITFFPDRPDVLSTLPGADERPTRRASRCCCRNGNPVAAGELRDGTPLGRVARSLPQALLSVRAGRRRSRRQSRQLHHPLGPRGRARHLGARRRSAERTEHAMAALKAAMKWDEEVYRPRIRPRRVQHRRRQRFQHRGDGEQGPQHLQLALHPGRPRHRDRRRLRRDRRRRRARIFPQLVGQPGHLPRLVPALAEGRLHRLPRPELLGRHGLARRSSGSRTCACCAPRSSPRMPGRSRIRCGPIPIIEISNFYTATVYNKGAEVIRMMHTMLGPERFRAGCDLYFERHDGAGGDLRGFRPRDGGGERASTSASSACGTSRRARRKVTVRLEHDGGTAALHARAGGAADAGPARQAADADPAAARAVRRATTGASTPSERLVMLDEAQSELVLRRLRRAPPVLSINRDFSAPVDRSRRDRAAGRSRVPRRARRRSVRPLRGDAAADARHADRGGRRRRGATHGAGDRGGARTTLTDAGARPAFVAEAMLLPSEAFIGDQMAVGRSRRDPSPRARRCGLSSAATLEAALARRLCARHAPIATSYRPAAKGARRLRDVALGYLRRRAPPTRRRWRERS